MTKHDLALSRRALISAMLSAGGGLAVGVFVPSFAQAKQLGAALSGDESLAPREMNAFIVIDPDNTVTVRLPHTEMGQGRGHGPVDDCRRRAGMRLDESAVRARLRQPQPA